MNTIRIFRDIDKEEKIVCDDILLFVKSNLDLFYNGYRIYKEQAAESTDITENTQELFNCVKNGINLVVLKPANGPEVWIPLLISALVSVATILLAPTPKAPDNAARSQSSSTNSLGSRDNSENINGRIDDIYGKVSRHVPPLLQVPHFRFTDNIETENFALILGVGQGLQENYTDGETLLSSIPGAKLNSWNPGKSPNNNDAPDLQIGGLISRHIDLVNQSRELNPSELLPPNDLSIGSITWELTGLGTVGTFFAASKSDDLDLTDYFNVSDFLIVSGFNYFAPDGSLTLWYDFVPPATRNYSKTLPPVDVGSGGSIQYEITNVTSDTITVFIDLSLPGDVAVFDAWQAMNNYEIIRSAATVESLLLPETYILQDPNISGRNIFTDQTLTDPVTANTINYTPAIDSFESGFIGPFTIPENTQIITINLVSLGGFYKLDRNDVISISALVRVVIEETNAIGIPTGNTSINDYNYDSNNVSPTSQAATTIDTTTPYQYSTISMARITDRDKNDNISNVDKIEWRDLYFTENIGNPDFGNVSIAQVAITSNPAARGIKARQIKVDWTRYITPYIGGGNFGPFTPVDTVAECSIALALDKNNGRLELDDIDADLMLEVQQELVDYYGNTEYIRIGYDFDSTKLRFQDMFSLMWGAVNCKTYAQNGVYKVYADINRLESSKQFTHRNKIPNTDKRTRKYRPKNENDGVELTYRSNDTAQYETITLHTNGIDSFNRLKIELSGAVNEQQALTRANRELNYLKYSRVIMEFESDGIGRLTVPGERVDNVDGTRISKRENNTNTYNIYDGMVEDISGLTVQLSQPVVFEPAETHSIRFTDKDGNLLESITCTAGDTAYHVVLASLPSEAIYVGYKREKTTFTFASDASREALPMIVRDLKASKRQGMETRKISGINYSPLYYTNDKDFEV